MGVEFQMPSPGDFPNNETSKWLETFFKQVEAVIQSDDQTALGQSILKFQIIFEPEMAGGCTADSTKRESFFKETSVIQT